MSIAQQVRQASQGMWADAHAPGGLERNDIQASIIMTEVLTLIEKDPVGAAKSWIGDLMLPKYGWMMQQNDVLKVWGPIHGAFAEKNNHYPYRFELVDILGPNVREIIEQLVADEYCMGGPDSSPFTPEPFLRAASSWRNPFDTYERPNVTVEIAGETYNEGGAIVPKPKEGFREL
jgi:hypothetical protein